MAKRYAFLFYGNDTDKHPDPKPPVKSAPYRLLLVDDEPNILASLRRVFQRENYELLFARSTDEALKILEKQPVELIMTGCTIHPLLCKTSQMQARLAEIFGDSNDLEDITTKVGSDDPYESIEIVLDEDTDQESLEQLLGSSEEPPAIRLVNAIILEALRLGASDIHIHPRTKSLMVRYRVDGVLQDKIHIPINLLMSVVSRIKVMAELDITERRRPQDGWITVKTPMRIVDLRISTLPTINGEKVVMRVLERQSSAQSLEDLGLSRHNRGRGCEKCHKGYKGRVAIHKVLTMNEELRIAITEGVSAMQIETLARKKGMMVLLDDALEKLRGGLATADEILRLPGPQVLHG